VLRRLVIACSLALLAVAAPASAAAPARAGVAGCNPALAEGERFVVFEGDMRSVKGAARMQMRFGLQARPPAGKRWVDVAAAGFGSWTTADAGVPRYVYRKRVEGLVAPARYRAVVRFRWLSRQGRVLRRAQRTTGECVQPDLRPDLKVGRVELVGAAGPGLSRYRVRVRNEGRGAAGPFSVALRVAGQDQPPGFLPGLAPGRRLTFELVAAACAPRSALLLVVDPDGSVAESDEGDNSARRPCPR